MEAALRTDGAFWALLIGIDEYQMPQLNTLRGCCNYVEAVLTFLLNQLHVEPANILTLTNGAATRAGILRACREFLIENPAIAPSDQILIYYAGHGSQMRDPLGVEPDGYNESIVPHDARSPGVFDIPDKTLAALLEAVAARTGAAITVVLDSCHSGSGTRGVRRSPAQAAVRLIGADDRLPPDDLDADLHALGRESGTGSSGWARANLPYVLLSGCRDREEANEYSAAGEDQPATWHGAFTYFLLRALRNATAGISYAELHEQVAAQVSAIYPTQAPQCEGDTARVVFGGVRVERDPFIPVTAVAAGRVSLAAGLVHGLHVGTQLAIYPPGVRTREDLPPTPLATVEVTGVAATTAQALILGQGAATWAAPARALVTRQVYGGLRQSVALEAGGAEDRAATERLRQAIERATPSGEPSPYLALQHDPSVPADLRVVASGGRFHVYNAAGTALVAPEDIAGDVQDEAVALRQALEAIVRFRSLLALDNQEAGSQLAGRLAVRLRRYVADQSGPRAEDLPVAEGELALYFDPDDNRRNLYVVELTNNSTLPLYPHIFILSADYSIHRLYPRLGQQEALPPGATLACGLENPQELLEVYLPAGWNSSRDCLKVIAGVAPADLSALEQQGLNVPVPEPGTTRSAQGPLERLLGAALDGRRTRLARPNRTAAGEDWSTLALPFTTLRAARNVTLGAGAERVELQEGVTLLKPAGFQGQIGVSTLAEATRGAATGLRPPPGMAAFPDLFQPLGRTATRGFAAGGMVLTLEVDEASRALISRENPLRLVLDEAKQGVADLMPVIFDGEDYLLAGYGGDQPGVVELVDLPAPAMPEGAPASRGLMPRLLQLFIYKKMGHALPELGLRRAALVDNEVVYSPVADAPFTAGQRVALFVHGFNSNTRWMISAYDGIQRQYGLTYDHLLTWDYETLGTGVQENGEALAAALTASGLGPADGVTIDVFAHSMGTLVTRCLVELAGGAAYIDRAILAGPPNRGSRLASLSRGMVFLVTNLINFASVIPPIGVANFALKQVYDQSPGWVDISVDSPILRKLNQLREPTNVPYLVLAGENPLPQGAGERVQRIAKKMLDGTLDSIFGEQNDVAVPVSSMRAVRGGTYRPLVVQVLPCDHFHYYVLPEALQTIRDWFSGSRTEDGGEPAPTANKA